LLGHESAVKFGYRQCILLGAVKSFLGDAEMVQRVPLSSALLSAAVLSFLTGSNPVGAVTITNNSFESRYVTHNDPSSGTTLGADCCGGGTIIPGFKFAAGNDGTQNQGVTDPSATFGNPVGTDGSVFGFVNNAGTITYTDPLGVIAPNTTYTLTVALGNNRQDATNSTDPGTINFGRPGSNTIALTANGTPVAGTGTTNVAAFSTGTIPTIPNDTFVDFTAFFTSGADSSVDPLVGQSLGIVLSATALDGGSQSLFDNVRLNAVVVPEPTSLGLIGLAGLGLLARRRA
jgi:PEP-CTERM motif